MYRSVIRPVLFLFSPENAHAIVAFLLKIPLVKTLVRLIYGYTHPSLVTRVAGLEFRNPVGLAAGFDKDAALISEMASTGFGAIEIGTLTPLAQPGNPKPRLFRLPEDKALINRMGFNNKGVDAAIGRLKKRKKDTLIIGGNIGKNKNTPLEQAVEDYRICFERLYPYVDYFVVNVSSPNTPNLRQLQDREPLMKILGELNALNSGMAKRKPVFLKIAPDLTNSQLDDIIGIVADTGTAGIVATNTTIGREGLRTDPKRIETIGAGGLSGLPVKERSTEVIRYIVEKSGGRIPVIGVGGIHSPADALEKLDAGASLIQLYTGFIYEGPALVSQINRAIVEHRKKRS